MESVARKLSALQFGKSHRHTLGRSYPIFAVERHAVTDIKQHDCSGSGSTIAFLDHQIIVMKMATTASQ